MRKDDVDSGLGDIKIRDVKEIIQFLFKHHPYPSAIGAGILIGLIAIVVYGVVYFARTSFYPGPITRFQLQDGTVVSCRMQISEGCGYQFSMCADGQTYICQTNVRTVK